MSWFPIRHGDHINWDRPDPLSGSDPYLVWADGSAFASYGGLPANNKIPTLIELKPGKTVADLIAQSGGGLTTADVPACYRPAAGGPRFVTGWPTAAFFERLQTALADIVARAEISLPVIPERPKFPPLASPACTTAVQRGAGRKIIIGVIDDGCAFAHYQLRDSAGKTRVCRMWDQDEHGAFALQGSVPADFGRGREVTGAQLQTLIDAFTTGNAVDEDGCYAAASYDRLRYAAVHGACVTDVVAGAMPVGSRVGTALAPPSWARPGDAASSDEAGIVFVQMPRTCLQDPSGGWLDVQVLDAMRYILSCADEHTEKVAINLSFGPQRGPNNGTAMLEKAFEELVAEHPKLTLTFAAGNSFSARGHAVLPLAANESQCLHWQVMPGDETPSFVQLWMPAGTGGVRVRLTPPFSAAGPWIAAGDAQVWPQASSPACAVIYPGDTSRGRSGTMALIALQSSSTFNSGSVVAPHGLWKVEVRNEGPALPAPVHAWIDRDDFNLGTLLRGRQSEFVDPLYDPLKYLRSASDDTPGSAALVRRRGTLTGIATGTAALVAAGYRASDAKHVRYSSAGPTRGPRVGPDCAAVTDQARSLPGLLSAGTRGASLVRLVGTSVAAPELARWVVDGKPLPGPTPAPDPQLMGRGLLPLKLETAPDATSAPEASSSR
ncbi:S8 family serine peptidase [Caenimonas soli]|uniref:S8 family serine peptidase n=1 Tax=Caenimonas soli TaxID=2735555 RepID=UPI001556E5BC|nr:S8 family serine peptidase [Caenimonas soli]NPC57760.1 S8 family serine peptidase [Caenimonas soli]